MSKRCPPIFNVILFAIAFTVLNPIANMIPWLPEAIKTVTNNARLALTSIKRKGSTKPTQLKIVLAIT